MGVMPCGGGVFHLGDQPCNPSYAAISPFLALACPFAHRFTLPSHIVNSLALAACASRRRKHLTQQPLPARHPSQRKTQRQRRPLSPESPPSWPSLAPAEITFVSLDCASRVHFSSTRLTHYPRLVERQVDTRQRRRGASFFLFHSSPLDLEPCAPSLSFLSSLPSRPCRRW